MTLSEKTGRVSVRGIGNGGGFDEPKRSATACNVSRAFLKQYTAGLYVRVLYIVSTRAALTFSVDESHILKSRECPDKL